MRGGAAGRQQLLGHAQFLRAVDLVTDDVEIAEATHRGAAARRLLARSWRLMRDWGIGTRDVAAASANPDTRYFAAWASGFEDLCRERSWVDPGTLPASLLPEISAGAIPLASTYVLAGFDRMTPSQRRLFAALDDGDRLAGKLRDRGCAAAHRLDVAEPREERRLAARWARQQLAARPDGSIGIIVPDLSRHAAEFRRSFLDTFDPWWRDRDGVAFPVSVDDGATLADTGYVSTALMLLRVPAGRLDHRELGQLLRSPYLRDGVTEAVERARFDLRIRDGKTQTVDLRALCRRESAGRPEQFLAALENMLNLAEQTRRRREPAAWLPVIDSLLKAAGLGQGRPLGQDEERVRDAWEGLLEQFATFGDIVGDVTFGAARRLLDEAARDRRSRAPARADGVQILSPWEAGGHKFDAVWLCGMTSEAWPPVARPSPLIPFRLQHDRGVPEAQPDLYRHQALAAIDRLLEDADESVASWSARAGEEERAPAPKIRQLPVLESGRLDVAGDEFDFRTAIGTVGRTDEVPDPPPALSPGERVRGGARLVDLQSVCPARAFFELRLGARELVSPPFALDAATRGNLLHDAAHALYESVSSAGGLAGADDAGVAEAISRAIDLALDKHIPGRHPLAGTLRHNERHRLARLLGMLIARDRERDEFSISELEGVHEICVGEIELKVRFDRVDESPGGAKLVIDYKTGAHFSIRNCLGERPTQLQLPLYAAFGAADGIALYWVHPDRVRIDAIAQDAFGTLNSARSRIKPLDEDAWESQVRDWRRTLEGLIAEFVAGDCRIDLEEDRWARGQFAMLTRRWDVVE